MRKVLNNRILLFIVAILLLANISILFYFLRLRDHDKHNDHDQRQRSPIGSFLEDQVGFDTTQMARYEAFRQESRKKNRQLFEDIRLAKVAFYAHLGEEHTPDSVLQKAAMLIGHKQTLADLQAFNNFRTIRTICTPEQQPKYDSLIAGEIGKMWFPSSQEKDRQNKENRQKR